jgi:hypothetical protein
MNINYSKNLTAIQKPGEILEFFDGSRLLVLPYGGRILGLFPPGSEENFFWTHPALDQAESARDYFASSRWHNPGGDRTWLAPELEFFYERYLDSSTYRVPDSLDPGNYRMRQDHDGSYLVSELAVRSARTGVVIPLRITKTIFPAANPLSDNEKLFSHARYAGFTLHTVLELLKNSEASIGLWDLLELPYGGEFLAATHSLSRPTIYFGDVDPSQIVSTDHLVRWRMTGGGIQKIGLKAVHVTGRVGYLYRQGPQWSLVVRNFSVNPSGRYVDSPPGNPAELGHAIQACCVNTPDLRDYVEIECHTPAIGAGEGDRSEDRAQIWAFRGDLEVIHNVACLLLGPEVIREKSRSAF